MVMGQTFQNNCPWKYDITLCVKHFVVQGLIVEAKPMLRFQESQFHECRHSFLYSSTPFIQLAKVPAISMWQCNIDHFLKILFRKFLFWYICLIRVTY